MEKANNDAGQDLDAERGDVDVAPPSDVRLTKPPTDADLRAFLGRPEAQARIRQVVAGRLRGNAPASLIDDLQQQVNLEALSSKFRPRSMGTAVGWLGTLTKRTVANHFRREAIHAKWLQPKVDVEDLPIDADAADGPFAPDWLLTTWLAPLVAEDPRHQETYELLVYKAGTGKTLAQVAADHGMTEGALKSRIHSLKTKYEPRWRRRQRRLMLLFLFGLFAVALVIAIAWLLSRPATQPSGSLRPPATPILDRVFGGPLPVSHPPPNGGVGPADGSVPRP